MSNNDDLNEMRLLACAGPEKIQGLITSLVSRYIEEHKLIDNCLFKPSIPQIAANLDSVKDVKFDEIKWIVLNGCGDQCVNKILQNNGAKPFFISSVSKLLKSLNIVLTKECSTIEGITPHIPKIAEELINQLKEYIVETSKSTDILIKKEFHPEYSEIKEYIYTKFKFKVPFKEKGLFYSWNDTWVHFDGELVWMGISDYLQQNLSDILMIQLPKVGEKFEQMDAMATLESSKTINEMLTPFSGEIIIINETLNENPELINSDPYGKGWICAMKPSKIEDERENVMNPQEYFNQMEEKVAEHK
jgi:glycine cleavage system H protein